MLLSGRGLLPTPAEATAALLSGVLFAIAFPPFPLVVPAFVCLVPLAAAIAERADAAETARSAARIGFWFAIIAYGVNLYWIAIALSLYTKLAILGYLATVLTIAAIIAATSAALFFARRATRLPMAVLLPVVWVASEVAFNHLGDISFPWLPLGLATARTPLLAQLADLSGVRGVSVWIAAIDGLLADAWLARAARGRAARALVVAVVVFGAGCGYGAWRLATIHPTPLQPVAIVQPDVPQEEKWQAENQGRILDMLVQLTRQRLDPHDARLIVWPEAALPGFLVQHPEWRQALMALSAGAHTPILFGVLDVTFTSPTDYEYYNAAMLADSTGSLTAQPAYHKTYLVPIVERVPFLNPRWFQRLKYFGGYARGGRPAPYTVSWAKFGTLICYESIFAQRSRLYRREGADFLVNITNDAWFGRTLAPHQHEAHLALRAIENRVGIVRAANTGISAYVDPLGRFHGETALFTPLTRTYVPETTSIRTLYVRLGDWAGMLCVIGTVVMLAIAWRRGRTA